MYILSYSIEFYLRILLSLLKNTFFCTFFLCTFLSISNNAEAQFQWVSGFGGSSSPEMGQSVYLDTDGNVYTTGHFQGTSDFDPGPGVFNLSTFDAYPEIFISKLDVSGNFIWAKSMGLFDDDYGHAITTDNFGNVYVTGIFRGNSTIGSSVFIAVGTYDIFLCKLDPLGNYLWQKQFSGSGTHSASSIDLDANGNIYLTGYNSGTCDFDPTAGTFNLISNSGTQDIFVCKLNPSGNLIWAKQMSGPFSEMGNSIQVDNSGNVYVTGSFSGTVDFDPNVGVYNLTALTNTFNVFDIFVTKIDSNGVLVWALQLGGNQADYGNEITLDPFGTLVIGGTFSGTADFDPTAGVSNISSYGLSDACICKLDNSGNLIWAKQFGGVLDDTGNSLTIDSDQNIYVTGTFKGTADFDPNSPVFNFLAQGTFMDMYICEVDTNGEYVCAVQISGSSVEVPNSIIIDASQNVHTTGYFVNTVDFDPSPNVFNLIAAGSNVFVHKTILDCVPILLPIELIDFHGFPYDNFNKLLWQTVTEINNDYFTLEKSLNANLWESITNIDGAGNSTSPLQYEFDDHEITNSICYYRLKQTDFNGDYSYSNTVAISRNEIEMAEIFPNPTTYGILSILIVSNFETEVTIIGQNTAGQTVYSKDVQVIQGSNFIELNIEHLSDGLYHLKATTDTGLSTSVKQVILSR
jgi:hypothetical protein